MQDWVEDMEKLRGEIKRRAGVQLAAPMSDGQAHQYPMIKQGAAANTRTRLQPSSNVGAITTSNYAHNYPTSQQYRLGLDRKEQ